MATIGTLVVNLVARSRDFDRAMGRAQASVKSFGVSARGLATATAAVGVAGAGLVILGKKVFDLGASVAETESKFRTVFGGASASVQEFVNTFAAAAGLTQEEGKAILATTGSIAQGMGFAQEASAAFSQQVVALAGDLGSFNNVPTAEVARSIQAALTGERESLKRLGVVILETDVQQRALTITGKESVDQLTQQDKATATLELITQKAGVAIGDLARTSDSASNVAKRLRARFKEIGETFATEMQPSLEELLPLFEKLAERALVWAKQLARFSETLFDVLGITNSTFRAWRTIIDDMPQTIRRFEITIKNLNIALRQMATEGQENTDEYMGLARALDLAQTRLARMRREAERGPLAPLVEDAKVAGDKIKTVAEETETAWTGAIQSTQSSFEDLFANLLREGVPSFKKFAQNILEIWLRLQAEILATKLFAQIGEAVFGAIGAPAGAVTEAVPAGSPIASLQPPGITAAGSALVINQTINLNLAAVDGASAAAFLRTQKGTIAELMGEAAQESPGFARMIRGR